MTCLFLGLLPTDVQIDILHVWLDVAGDRGRCLLKVLSALDVGVLFLGAALFALPHGTAASFREEH